MRLLFASATYMLPSFATPMPVGALKLAAEPVPSAKLAAPDPARDDTTPAAEIWRMRAFELSEIYATPLNTATS